MSVCIVVSLKFGNVVAAKNKNEEKIIECKLIL